MWHCVVRAVSWRDLMFCTVCVLYYVIWCAKIDSARLWCDLRCFSVIWCDVLFCDWYDWMGLCLPCPVILKLTMWNISKLSSQFHRCSVLQTSFSFSDSWVTCTSGVHVYNSDAEFRQGLPWILEVFPRLWDTNVIYHGYYVICTSHCSTNEIYQLCTYIFMYVKCRISLTINSWCNHVHRIVSCVVLFEELCCLKVFCFDAMFCDSMRCDLMFCVVMCCDLTCCRSL